MEAISDCGFNEQLVQCRYCFQIMKTFYQEPNLYGVYYSFLLPFKR